MRCQENQNVHVLSTAVRTLRTDGTARLMPDRRRRREGTTTDTYDGTIMVNATEQDGVRSVSGTPQRILSARGASRKDGWLRSRKCITSYPCHAAGMTVKQI